MEPPSDAKSHSRGPESSLFSDTNFSNFFDDLPEVDEAELGPGLPSPPSEDFEYITSMDEVPPNVDPDTARMDKVFSRDLIKVENDDGNQEMLSGSKIGQETKNSISADDQDNVDNEEEDIEVLRGFSQYLMATMRKPSKDDIVKEFVQNFLHGNADPEEVTKRIRALMKRYMDSLKNDDGKGETGEPSSRSPQNESVFGLCKMIFHLITFASMFRMENVRNLEGGSSSDDEEIKSSESIDDEGSPDGNPENESAADEKDGSDLEIPGENEILRGFLKYCVAKSTKPYPYSFSHDELHDFVKNWLHSNAPPKEVDKKIRELMKKHEDSLKKNEEVGKQGPSSSDHDPQVSRFCQMIISSVPYGVSGYSNSDEEAKSSGSVNDESKADKNPRDDQFPVCEQISRNKSCCNKDGAC